MSRALALAALLLLGAPFAGAQEERRSLEMLDYEYRPPALGVPPGASVLAVNLGAEPHTVTAVERSLFDVQNVAPGANATFRAPDAPGTYPYYCVYHGDDQGRGMAGTLVVAEVAPPAPSVEAPRATPWGAVGALAVLALAALARGRQPL